MAFPKFIRKALKLGKIEREILHIGHMSLVPSLGRYVRKMKAVYQNHC